MDIARSWAIIESVLEEEVPYVLESLNTGATDKQLDHLESVVGMPLPLDFRQSWKIHNGQECDAFLFNYDYWLSIDQIIGDYEMFRDLFEDDGIWEHNPEWCDQIQCTVWVPGWVKFSEENGGGFVLDLNPTEAGSRGQIFYRANAPYPGRTYGNSFQSFLSEVAMRLFAGDFTNEGDHLIMSAHWGFSG